MVRPDDHEAEVAAAAPMWEDEIAAVGEEALAAAEWSEDEAERRSRGILDPDLDGDKLFVFLLEKLWEKGSWGWGLIVGLGSGNCRGLQQFLDVLQSICCYKGFML